MMAEASSDTAVAPLTTDNIDDLPSDSLLYMYYNTPVNQNLAGYNQVGTVLDVAAELEVEEEDDDDDDGEDDNDLDYGATSSQPKRKYRKRRKTTRVDRSCEICFKSFSYEKGLARHMRSLHGIIPSFECDTCGQEFERRDLLRRHKVQHNEGQPIKCSICNKEFSRKEHLTRHFRLHTRESPYECEHCHKTFIRSDYLKKHVIRAHSSPFISDQIRYRNEIGQL